MLLFSFSILLQGCSSESKIDTSDNINEEPSIEPIPTAEPNSQPTSEPSSQPTSEPSSQPASEPNAEPNADSDNDGFTIEEGDCNDSDATIYPESEEIIGDGIDQDCDGLDWLADMIVEGITFKYIPPATFSMGSPDTEIGRGFDETQREITLTNGFFIMETELTQSSYQSLMGSNPSTFSSCGSDCPVDNITWHQATSAANALSDIDGLENCYTCTDDTCVEQIAPYECNGYRLPTEAEWEYAAQGQQSEPFYSASPEGTSLNQVDTENCSTDVILTDGTILGDLAWYCGNSSSATHPGKEKLANPTGLYDMLGNLYEWTHDEYYIPDTISQTDPTHSGNSNKILKGGDWNNLPSNLRPSFRTSASPTTNYSRFGVRFVQTDIQ